MIRFVLILALSSLIFGCCGDVEQQNAELTSRVDSLNTELKEAQKAINTINEIQAILDSIASERERMDLQLVEGGIEREDYVERIEALSIMLFEAEAKLSTVEKERGYYAGLTTQLRKEVDARNKEVKSMQQVLKEASTKIITMAGTLAERKSAIEKLEQDIAVREQDLELLEARIELMRKDAQSAEAEAYFQRGLAYEETANRTKLAPKKKKETLTDALGMFRKSLDLGYKPAAAKIQEIQEKLN